MTEWFKGEPEFVDTPLRPVRREWVCPSPTCVDGRMVYNGVSWSMNPPGYHHTCNACGYTAALHGAIYPNIQYVALEQVAV